MEDVGRVFNNVSHQDFAKVFRDVLHALLGLAIRKGIIGKGQLGHGGRERIHFYWCIENKKPTKE